MDTNSEQKQNEKLQVLLSLKRHEQPPPGFYNRLSAEIMAQIRAGQPQQLGRTEPWFSQLWSLLEAKPVFASAFGVALAGLVVAGIAFHSASDEPAAAAIPVASAFSADASSPLVSAQLPATLPAYTGIIQPISSTGQVISLLPTAVERNPYALPVSAPGGFR